MMKTYIVLVLLLVSCVDCRRRFGGRAKGVAKTGAVLGDAVVNLLKDMREKPQALPKNYKREVERPVIEQYTLLYKIKKGFGNIVNYTYALLAIVAIWVVVKICKAIKRQYVKFRISLLPPEEQGELLNYVMTLKQEERKDIKCEDPQKTRELRLKNDRRRKLK